MLVFACDAVLICTQPLSEADIFSFALNLEFLECIFYTYAVKVRTTDIVNKSGSSSRLNAYDSRIANM